MLFVFFSLLPYICLPGTIWAFRLRYSEPKEPFFVSIINGALVWSSLIWLETNIFSATNGIWPHTIKYFWFLYTAILIGYIWKYRKNYRCIKINGFYENCIAIICGLTLIVALIYPPNMWDVMSYHLPRVMHWLQNHTLAAYPTNIPRQIGMPPFNSMIALQSLAMGGEDYFVNTAQWFAFIGLLIGGIRLAFQLGANKKAQIFTAFFIATLPTAITQASNTESSNIVAFWVLAMVSLTIDWIKKPDFSTAAKIGATLGFAILSKGSAYVSAFPFVLIVAWYCLRYLKKRFVQGVACACLVIIINIPHLMRTYEAYGSIVGGTERNILPMPTPGHFAANVLYNFLIHEPWLLKGPMPKLWQTITASLGVDENNIDYYPWGGIENAQKKFILEEASAQNVLGALILLAMAIAILFRRFRPPILYTSAVAGSFFMYFLLLTWHPWAGRIHTTMFVLSAPLVGIYVTQWRKTSWKYTLTAFLLIWTFFVFIWFRRPLNIFDDRHRNFLYNNREALYFNNYPPLRLSYIRAAHYLAALNPKSIGLDLYDDTFEYPLWAILSDSMRKLPEISHIRNAQDREKIKPEYILVLGKGSGNRPLAKPYILKRVDGEYIKVFPEKEQIGRDD